jgi:hypothetical protein
VSDLHERLLAEVQRRLDVARGGGGRGLNWRVGVADQEGRVEHDGEDIFPVVYDEGYPTEDEACHIALHDPADAIRRYEADLRRLERHRPGVNGRYCDDEACSGAARDGLIINWPCDEVRDLAASLGVEA